MRSATEGSASRWTRNGRPARNGQATPAQVVHVECPRPGHPAFRGLGVARACNPGTAGPTWRAWRAAVGPERERRRAVRALLEAGAGRPLERLERGRDGAADRDYSAITGPTSTVTSLVPHQAVDLATAIRATPGRGVRELLRRRPRLTRAGQGGRPRRAVRGPVRARAAPDPGRARRADDGGRKHRASDDLRIRRREPRRPRAGGSSDTRCTPRRRSTRRRGGRPPSRGRRRVATPGRCRWPGRDRRRRSTSRSLALSQTGQSRRDGSPTCLAARINSG